MLRHIRLWICLTLIISSINSAAQQVVTDTSTHKLVIAGPEYQRPKFYQKLWGHNARIEWTTPVCVPILHLDTVYGGLKPYKTGGGNETKSLRLRTSEGKEYVLRSINKSRDEVVPPELKNTFLNDVVNDGISMLQPYGALALPVMQQYAGIYHTLPKIVYVPRQPALDTFNNKYGNNLYLFEQKPEGDWREADNLGNFAAFFDTDEVIAKLQESSRYKVNQYVYLKSRLFDMLIGDWDRHKGNWSWGVTDTGKTNWYVPVPRDRDQSFYTHDGFLIDRLLAASGLIFMQHFDYNVKHIEVLNYEPRNMDRFYTNALSLNDWIQTAINLQQALTDSVIEQSVKQLPPEIFAVSGATFIGKLKSRRNQMVRYATRYYLFIAKEVEVPGTRQRDFFEVSSKAGGETTVSVFHIDSLGQREQTAWYQRKFKPGETKEIRLFGIDGEDIYVIRNHSKAISMRVIGGPGKDSIVQKGHSIHVYDNADNTFQTTSVNKHLSRDTSIHTWNYEWFNYSQKGFQPRVYYNNEDRIYIGVHYKIKKQKWRRTPFATKQSLGVHYSISQDAFSVVWSALYPKVVAGWNLLLQAEYDAMRWTNYYGAGNESKYVTDDLNYNRLRSEEWLAAAGLNKTIGKSTVGVQVYYQRTRTRNDTNGYLSKEVLAAAPHVYKPIQYGRLAVTYAWESVNDSIVPVKGFTFWAEGALVNNFTEKKFFQKIDTRLQTFIPFTKHLSLAIRLGGTTIFNDDVLNNGRFYQYAIIGGPKALRGYRRDRFWGKTAFYNSNELRFITDLHTYLLNGKIGVIAFFDQGRVWLPNEKSNKMHISYGPGLLLAPFNKFGVTATYGISEDIQIVQIRLNRLF